MRQRPTQRSTQQGSAVREALLAQSGFRSAQDIYAVLRSDGSSIGLSTVYRHLQSFADAGLADVIQTPDGEAAYRFCGEESGSHHHHLVCRRCGRAEQMEAKPVERWATEVARNYGWTDVDHTVELFGICDRCSVAG